MQRSGEAMGEERGGGERNAMKVSRERQEVGREEIVG